MKLSNAKSHIVLDKNIITLTMLQRDLSVHLLSLYYSINKINMVVKRMSQIRGRETATNDETL